MKQPLALLIAAAQLGYSAELPVRQVVLYKHGVGYFERGGEIKAGDSARLDFKAEEMNDVLKSLTLVDRNGGKISGVRYDSSEPLAVKLREFPFTIGEQASLAQFLDQCKGGRLEVQIGRDIYSGTIVGARTVPGKEGGESQENLTLLLDSNEIRVLNLSAATSVRFADVELQRKLKDYLGALSAARSKEKRSVYIDGAGNANRQLTAAYMVPTPVWKSSYRLLLSDAADSGLEGWAIVDNTTGEDWNGVTLALVSGRPVSFISPLYEPRYRTRAVADLPDDAAAAPTIYEGNVREQFAIAPGAPPPPPPPAPAPAQAMRKQLNRAFQNQVQVAANAVEMDTVGGASGAGSSAAVNTQAREAGELFEYRFGTPVTVKKSESAMLPFLQAKIRARKLLVYGVDNTSVHPQNAAELINSSGKTLDGGPITVYDAGTYAGEGLIDTLKNGDKRFIGYSVDLGTRISTKFDTGRQIVREFHASRGVLTTKTAFEETKTFTIRNVDAKAKTLIIEHPVRGEYKLLNQKPSSSTPSFYRFEVKIDPNKTETFPIVEERILESGVLLSSVTPDSLGLYLGNKNLSEAGRKALQQIQAAKSQVAALDTELKQVESDIQNLNQDQNRIRQNINSLNQVRNQQDQVQKYATTLADQETKLAALRDREGDLRKRRDAAQTALNRLFETLEF